VLNALGGLALIKGDVEAAQKRFEEALALGREVDNKVGMATALNNIAVVRQRQGDLVGAIDSFEQQLNLQRQLGDRTGEAVVLANIGSSLWARGDLSEARRKFEQAVAVFREVGNPSGLASALHTFGNVLVHVGNLDEARQRHREALEIRTDAGEAGVVLHSEYALALIDFEEAKIGRASMEQAAAAFAELVDRLSRADLPELEVAALTQLADARLAGKRVDQARATIDRARDLESRIADLSTQISIGIVEAQIMAAEGRPEPALKQLADLTDQIGGMGILGLDFELRYTTALVMLEVGRSAEARRELESLRGDAESRGWGLMAEKVTLILAD